MAETWYPPTSGGPFGVFIPTAPPAFTPTFIGTSATGLTHLSGSIAATYGVGAAGLPPTLATLSYPYLWTVGGSPSSSVTFAVTLSYADTASVWTPADMLSFSITKTSPSSGSAIASAAPILLPALPAGDTITVTGKFDLSTVTATGDTALIKTFGVPEPSTFWLLGSVATPLALAARRWRRRWQSTGPSATLSP